MSCPTKASWSLARPIDLPVQAVVILAPEESVKIKGEGIQDAGTRDIQGLQYHMYNGPAMPSGSELRLTVTGKLQGGAMNLTTGSNTNLLIGAGCPWPGAAGCRRLALPAQPARTG